MVIRSFQFDLLIIRYNRVFKIGSFNLHNFMDLADPFDGYKLLKAFFPG